MVDDFEVSLSVMLSKVVVDVLWSSGRECRVKKQQHAYISHLCSHGIEYPIS